MPQSQRLKTLVSGLHVHSGMTPRHLSHITTRFGILPQGPSLQPLLPYLSTRICYIQPGLPYQVTPQACLEEAVDWPVSRPAAVQLADEGLAC